MYTYRRRVHYYENDGMQVVHHANYVHWLEEARVEYLREGGILLNDLTAAGIVCPILEVNIKYISSARNDDVVLVKTWLRELNWAKMVFEYEIYREGTNELLCRARTLGGVSHADTGHLTRLPAETIARLAEISEGDRK